MESVNLCDIQLMQQDILILREITPRLANNGAVKKDVDIIISKYDNLVAEYQSQNQKCNKESFRLKIKIVGKETIVLTNIEPLSSLRSIKSAIQDAVERPLCIGEVRLARTGEKITDLDDRSLKSIGVQHLDTISITELGSHSNSSPNNVNSTGGVGSSSSCQPMSVESSLERERERESGEQGGQMMEENP
mmetsp:Transcript_15653/g.15782  ORF Transcript_15653/g.15782 Transcript_15653/m.15782 type:complete len:191 (+) Transcript_15653:130-702(+)